MIIHPSDRTPVEINEDEWKRETDESAIIDKDVIAFMAVIKSSSKYIVFAGAHHTSDPDDVVFEGGYYIVDRSEEDCEKKIYARLDSLKLSMFEKAKQRIGLYGDPARIYNVSVCIDNLFAATMRAMPPEHL